MYAVKGEDKIHIELRLRSDNKLEAVVRIKLDEQGNYISCAKQFNIPDADYDELLIFIYSTFPVAEVTGAAERVLDKIITNRAKTYKPYEL